MKVKMQNDDFARLIACDVPVKTAFEVIHSNEIQAVLCKSCGRQHSQEDCQFRKGKSEENQVKDRAIVRRS
ncbi:MAG: hypothetical protein ACLUR5_06650 [Eubacterium ventriosum]